MPHSLNIPPIFTTFDVSKLLTSKLVMPHSLNIAPIFVTSDVSRADKSIDVILLKPAK